MNISNKLSAFESEIHQLYKLYLCNWDFVLAGKQVGRLSIQRNIFLPKILEPWHMDIPIQSCIETFWSGLRLKTEIYPETINVLQKLKEKGYTMAALTDLPCAMPDEIFRRDISELLGCFDYYVSSAVAGHFFPYQGS